MDSLLKLGISLWDLIFYIVNFGLIVWIVSRYFLKPLLKVLDERTDTIKNNIDEAEELRSEMAKQKKLMEDEKVKMQSELADQMAQSRKEIEAKRKAAETEIESKKAKMLEDVQTVIASEKAKIIQSAEADALALVQKVVLHVVSNQVPQEVVKSSVQSAWSRYAK